MADAGSYPQRGSGGGVPTTRTITAGDGLTGGGALSADLTISALAADASIVAAVGGLSVGVINATQHGAQTDGTLHAAAVASGASGFMTGADKAKLDGLPSSAVPTTRTITAGAGLTGGGDLSANRTLGVDPAATLVAAGYTVASGGTFSNPGSAQTQLLGAVTAGGTTTRTAFRLGNSNALNNGDLLLELYKNNFTTSVLQVFGNGDISAPQSGHTFALGSSTPLLTVGGSAAFTVDTAGATLFTLKSSGTGQFSVSNTGALTLSTSGAGIQTSSGAMTLTANNASNTVTINNSNASPSKILSLQRNAAEQCYVDTFGSIFSSGGGFVATASNQAAYMKGNATNGGTAVGVQVSNANSLTNATADVMAWYPDNFGTKVASVRKSGALHWPTGGAAAVAGQATLVGGTVTVNTSAVTANSLVHLTRATAGGAIGDLTYTVSAGTSITINSASGTDTSVVNWFFHNT